MHKNISDFSTKLHRETLHGIFRSYSKQSKFEDGIIKHKKNKKVDKSSRKKLQISNSMRSSCGRESDNE